MTKGAAHPTSFHGLRVTGFLPAGIKALEEGPLRQPVPAGKSAFEWLLEPILGDLRDCYFYTHWFASTPVLSALMDQDEAWDETWERVRLERPSDPTLTHICFRPDVITAYRRSVPDDWIVLNVFRASDEVMAHRIADRFDEAVAAAEAGDRSLYWKAVRANDELVACCLDGLTWEIFPGSAEHRMAIAKRASDLGLQAVACELEESLRLGAAGG